jgi:hypothetical protein
MASLVACRYKWKMQLCFTMTRPSQSSCVFCRLPAGRHVRPELLATDIDCRECGHYRIGPRAEATMLRFGALSNGAWVHVIANANAGGQRLVIPGGQRTPLESHESDMQRRAS